jgi:hypothetical protein
MPLRTLHLALLLSCGALLTQADSIGGWSPDRQHPAVQYRFKCKLGALTIEWRNSYLGAVTLKAAVRGAGYVGEEQIVIPPGGSATSDVDTLNCFAESFQITEERFSMAKPPPPPTVVPNPGSPEAKVPAPLLPTVAPWVPPARLPELTPEALTAIHIGMKQREVLQRIGNPTSKLAIPEENELVETYRYPVSPGRVGIIRFSNGTVTEVAVPSF